MDAKGGPDMSAESPLSEDAGRFLQQVLLRLAPNLVRVRGTETRLALYLLTYDVHQARWVIMVWRAPEFAPTSFVLLHQEPLDMGRTPQVMEERDVRTHPLLSQVPLVDQYHSFYWIPLDGEAMLAAHPGRGYFNAARRKAMDLVADVYRLHRAWEKERQENAWLHRRLYDLEQEVRRRLARDLHDGPAQTLSSLVMELAYLRYAAQEQPEMVAERLEELEQQARRAVEEIRHLLYVLRPMALEQGSLSDALRQLVERARRTFAGELLVEGDVEALAHLPQERSRHLFYLIAEALTNAIKHANAQRITLRIRREDGLLTVEVQDDGLGFDPEAAAQTLRNGHYGLLNMEERAALLGGELTIDTAPGRGTTVRVRFPISRKPA